MADGEKEKTDEGIRSFTRMIDGVDEGQAQLELASEFHDLCVKLRTQARRYDSLAKGNMQLTIGLSVNGRGELQIAVDSKNTVKKRAAQPSSAWMTEGGNVQFESPRQTSLQLREVMDPATGEIKEVETETEGSEQ